MRILLTGTYLILTSFTTPVIFSFFSRMTSSGEYQMKVEMQDVEGKFGRADYQDFSLSGADQG